MARQRKSDPARLLELRAKIDAIDESVHRLLMQRASVIDELISVKGTARNGAAFRPGREAEMMRRLAERHEGHLPLTAIEHLWREIISTFTCLQAPFDVVACREGDAFEAAETARFYFGFTVPLFFTDTAREVADTIEAGGDRLGLVPLGNGADFHGSDNGSGPWWTALESAQIVARLPFLKAEGRPAASPFLVLSPPLADPAPPEIGCFRVEGLESEPHHTLEIEILACGRSEDGRFACLAATAGGESAIHAAMGSDLDIRAVGGYAAPQR